MLHTMAEWHNQWDKYMQEVLDNRTDYEQEYFLDLNNDKQVNYVVLLKMLQEYSRANMFSTTVAKVARFFHGQNTTYGDQVAKVLSQELNPLSQELNPSNMPQGRNVQDLMDRIIGSIGGDNAKSDLNSKYNYYALLRASQKAEEPLGNNPEAGLGDLYKILIVAFEKTNDINDENYVYNTTTEPPRSPFS